MDSAVPVNVGVESFCCEVLVKEAGASGAVVSDDELELEEVDPLLPETVDFPANVSKGINNMKPNVDNKTTDLYKKFSFLESFMRKM